MKQQRFSSAALLNILQQQEHFGRYMLAFSGGVDSHVLLYALAELARSEPIQLRVVHIDHGLQKKSGDWAKHCHIICKQLGVPCELVALKLGEFVDRNLEAQARDARYKAFAERLKPQEYLLTAHHQDDQAETVLLHLLRGSGVQGLAAMPQRRRFAQGYLCRPLLAFSRTELTVYAEQHKLDYQHDPSNDDTHFDRNFLRHEIIPRLQTHWPAVNTNLSRVARLQTDASELIAQQAQQDLKHCAVALKYGLAGHYHYSVSTYKPAAVLLTAKISKLSFARQKNLLYYWIKSSGFPLTSEKKIKAILFEVLNARVDAVPCVAWQDAEVRRYQKALYLLPNVQQSRLKSHNVEEYTWDIHSSLEIQSGIYTWRLQPQALEHFLLPIKQSQQQDFIANKVTVRFRRGGEQMRTHSNGGEKMQSLKKILYEAKIPPWERKHIPLVYYRGRLLIVLGVCLAARLK